jgi:uncharacterized protein (TIGR03437 family)
MPAFSHHADSTPVMPLSPVTIGETLTVYATRLGTSTHQAMRVASPRASTVISATVSSGGAQSAAGGVYLVNLTVRVGVRSGDVDLDISSPDAYNRSVLIPVGSSSSGADSATPLGVRRLETQKMFPRVWRKPFKTLRLAGRP